MAQRVHPNVYRIGVTKPWNYKYLEKKSIEQPNYDFVNLEVKKFILKFFKDNNFNLYNLKTNFCSNGYLHIFITYYSYELNKNNLNNVLANTNQNNNYFEYSLINYTKTLLTSNDSDSKINFLKKKIEKYTFNTTKLNSSIDLTTTTPYNLKLNFFFNKLIKNLNNFLGKKLNIFITFQELNNTLNKSLKKKSIKFLQRTITKLNKYKDNDFFKEGIMTLYVCSNYSNSANLLSEFIVRYLKKTKNPKFFLSFIKKCLLIFRNEKNFNNNEIKIKFKGRISKSARARKKVLIMAKKLPILSIKAKIDYSEKVIYTNNGTIGVKIWIYKNNIKYVKRT